MAGRRIQFNPFDPSSIASAVRQVEKFREDVLKCCDETLNKLADMGVEFAQSRVVAMKAFDTGILHDTIHAEHVSQGQRISKVIADAPYAAYVEYGTGVMGKNQPHSEAGSAGWAYDVNGHGEAGWYYYDWGYGVWNWTKGMPARPYMYQTKLYLEQQAPDVAASIFRNP